MVSAENSGKHLKKKITLILHNFFWKIGKEVAFPHSLYDARITLIAKSVKASYKTNNRPISVMNMDAKSLNKILANTTQQYLNRIMCHHQLRILPRMQGWFKLIPIPKG